VKFDGISLGGSSSNNRLIGNRALNNGWSGISLGGDPSADGNILIGNIAKNNVHNGIDLNRSFNNTITGNTVSGNSTRGLYNVSCGIGLWWGSSNNKITDNTVSGNVGDGIILGIAGRKGSNGNELTGNTISGNSRSGIVFWDSSNNTLTKNTISGNSANGIDLKNSSGNIIYLNNFISNGQNAVLDNSTNTWNSLVKMSYTYTGLPSISDADGNGVGDIPYSMDPDKDNYPLMQPFENYKASSTYTSYLGNYWSDYAGLAIPATIDLDPDTLNLESEGKWITCYIELLEGYDVEDIDIATVNLWYEENSVSAITDPKYDFVTDPDEYLTDHDEDGILERMVKFDRAAVRDLFTEPVDAATIVVTGALTDGPSFEGTDTIKVIEGEKGEAKARSEITQVKFGLSQNYPNPFNPETTIEYDIDKDCHVALKIYNLAGQLVKTLVDEYQTAGYHTVTWYGDNEVGQEVASGVYLYRIKAGDKAAIKKMVVLK